MRGSRLSAVWVSRILACLLFVTGAIAGMDAASDADSNTDTAAETTAETDAIEASPLTSLLVAPEAAVVRANDSEVSFTVLLSNEGERSLPEGSIELALGEHSPSGAVAIPKYYSDHRADDAPNVLTTETIASVDGESTREITVVVPIDEFPLTSASDRGVYPVFARYRPVYAAAADTSEHLIASSPLVWEGPDSGKTVNLSVVVPFVFPADVHSMPTRPQLADAAPRFEALLEFATETQATLAIDPRLIVAVRAYGDEAPEAARAFLDRLETTELTSFLLQFSDADPAAQAALGNTSLLEPNGYEFITRFGSWEQLAAGSEAPGDAGGAGNAGGADDASDTGETEGGSGTSQGNAAGDTAGDAAEESTSATPTDGAETANSSTGTTTAAGESLRVELDPTTGTPTVESLGAWPSGIAASWPAPGQVSSKTLTLVRNSGLDITVLTSNNVKLKGGPRASLGNGSAIVTDAVLDEAVALSLSGETHTHQALGAVQTAARLATVATKDGAGIVLGVDRGGIAEAAAADATLAQLTDLPFVRTLAVEKQESGIATLQTSQPEEERLLILQTAVANEAYVLEARSLLLAPEYLDSYQRMRLLTLFGSRYAGYDSNFLEFSKQYSQRDTELHDGVKLIDTKHTQLVGGSTRIPIQLRNKLPFDVAINLSVAPNSAALSVKERQFSDIVLPENSSDRVLVPVEARVSSGETSLQLSVTSLDGEYTASTAILPVSISTTVESIAIATLATAAVLLFAFGTWRSIRERRRAQAETTEIAAAGPTGGAPEPLADSGE